MSDLILLALLFGIPLIGASFVAWFLYKRLVKSGNKSPRLISILAFSGCYVLVFAVIFLIVVNSIRLN